MPYNQDIKTQVHNYVLLLRRKVIMCSKNIMVMYETWAVEKLTQPEGSHTLDEKIY